MTHTPLIVVAKIKAKRGKETELKDALLSLIEPTRAEEGCICYELHQSPQMPGLFLFYEIWKSKEDLDKHLQRPYLKNFFEKAHELLEQEIEITFWRKIA